MQRIDVLMLTRNRKVIWSQRSNRERVWAEEPEEQQRDGVVGEQPQERQKEGVVSEDHRNDRKRAWWEGDRRKTHKEKMNTICKNKEQYLV